MRNFLLLAALLLLAPACGKKEEQPATATAQKIRAYSIAEKRQYQEKIKTQLDNLERHIGELKKKAKRLEGRAREDALKQVGDLNAQRKRAEQKLRELGAQAEASTNEAWHRLKTSMDTAVGKLEGTYRRLKKRLA